MGIKEDNRKEIPKKKGRQSR